MHVLMKATLVTTEHLTYMTISFSYVYLNGLHLGSAPSVPCNTKGSAHGILKLIALPKSHALTLCIRMDFPIHSDTIC